MIKKLPRPNLPASQRTWLLSGKQAEQRQSVNSCKHCVRVRGLAGTHNSCMSSERTLRRFTAVCRPVTEKLTVDLFFFVSV